MYVVPNRLFTVDTGETVEFSVTLIAHKTVTCDLTLLVNWSPDNNTRVQWIPVEQEVSISLPDFTLIIDDLLPVGSGVYQFTATIQNDGPLATSGSVPISWEKLGYELPLVDGVGALDESSVDIDLNGNGVKTDTYTVTWFHDKSRLWDATINTVYVYSIFEGPPDDPGSYRSYYLDNNQPKLFQLGSETDVLYYANNEVISFGLDNADIKHHPSPNLELYFNTTSISATDFHIDGTLVKVNHTWKGGEVLLGESPWTSTVYLLPNKLFAINPGETVEISCTLTVQGTTDCLLALIVNWSPDSNTRVRWVPYYQKSIAFKGPSAQMTSEIPTTGPTTASLTAESITTSSTPSIGPGFEIPLILVVLMCGFILRRKSRK